MKVLVDTKELDELIENFQEEAPELIFLASVSAHRKLARQASARLKFGLAKFGGKKGTSDYKHSEPFEMPLAHTYNLVDSIGFKVIGNPSEQNSKVGANIYGDAYADYAKYLDSGYISGDEGIRPFIWFIADLFTANTWKNYFYQIFDKIKWDSFEIPEE